MTTPRKKVLVVEDDDRLARAISIRLKAAGYEVLHARGGVEGLRLAETRKPDLILADIFMPGGAGFAMAYRLNESASSIPIIFISGSKDVGLRRAARLLGAVDFLEKPYEPEVLLAAVSRRLEASVDAGSRADPTAAPTSSVPWRSAGTTAMAVKIAGEAACRRTEG